MAGFFRHYFKLDGAGGEQPVCCPFPHKNSAGVTYYESHPSAHVNLQEDLYHCKVCDAGYTEVSFIKEILGCTLGNAYRLQKSFNNTEDIDEWKTYTFLNTEMRALCHELGISDAVIEELNIASNVDGTLNFPAFMYNKLVDIRAYTPGGTPKLKSRTGSANGLVVPLDVWQETKVNRVTVVCAGEKDMAVARSNGLNAITITGGEMSLPLSPYWFRSRDIIICYDNDDAGIKGAKKLATYLLPYCNTVKVCTAFHSVCKEEKEDITDFFVKYKKNKADLIAFFKATPLFTKEDCIQDTQYPMLTLEQATDAKHLNKIVRTNVQVVAISETQYVVPTTILGEKIKTTGNDTMYMNEVREWMLTEDNLQEVLHLADNNFKEEDINKNIRKLLKIANNEKYVKLHKRNKQIVYKAYVTDMFESMNTNNMPMEYVAYCIGTRLESGKKYLVTHKLIPHPYKGQQLVMIITNAVQANDSISNFQVTDKVVEHLEVFKNITGTVEERMDILAEKVKGWLGYNGNNLLITTLDLSFHTALAFNLGQFRNIRGYLDTLIVGESRMGKSSTADCMRKHYKLGTFTSLAGNSATIPGLVGGSNKTAGGNYQTKAGVIPQNHKGLIIFEEFGKCRNDLITELTDIRSSNEVRITRISGTTTLPAMVRMIALTNVKASKGEIKSIASYPHGISIITELVGTAEDIARYDVLLVLGDKGATQIDPFWVPQQPFDDELYQSRIRWVWSRRPEQIVISEEVGKYIIEKANALNKTYDSHIKIFGTEAWKKITRLATAVAGYLVSTDNTYTNIIITKEHVDYAYNYFVTIYDNKTFRLREYVANEKKYNDIDEGGLEVLQQLYIKCPNLLTILEQEARISRSSLVAIAGLDQNELNAFMSQLTRTYMVRLADGDFLPTERFRLGMAEVDRRGSIRSVNEQC